MVYIALLDPDSVRQADEALRDDVGAVVDEEWVDNRRHTLVVSQVLVPFVWSERVVPVVVILEDVSRDLDAEELLVPWAAYFHVGRDRKLALDGFVLVVNVDQIGHTRD